MAKCFDVVGYVEPCNVVHHKYTGRALLITGKAGGETVNGSATFSTDGLIVTQIFAVGLFNGDGGFVKKWNSGGGKAVPVMIDVQNPFGVTIQGNTDIGRVMYTKTIPVTIPSTSDGKAEAFIMGLQKGLYGSAAIVLERFVNDENNRISEDEIFGAYSPLRLDPTSVMRSEYENGGAWTFNLVCDEPVPNVICALTGLDAALDELNV